MVTLLTKKKQKTKNLFIKVFCQFQVRTFFARINVFYYNFVKYTLNLLFYKPLINVNCYNNLVSCKIKFVKTIII